MNVIDDLEYEVVEALLPCTYCSGGDLGVFKDEIKKDWHVACCQCGKKSHAAWNRSFAIRNWNQEAKNEMS